MTTNNCRVATTLDLVVVSSLSNADSSASTVLVVLFGLLVVIFGLVLLLLASTAPFFFNVKVFGIERVGKGHV